MIDIALCVLIMEKCTIWRDKNSHQCLPNKHDLPTAFSLFSPIFKKYIKPDRWLKEAANSPNKLLVERSAGQPSSEHETGSVYRIRGIYGGPDSPKPIKDCYKRRIFFFCVVRNASLSLEDGEEKGEKKKKLEKPRTQRESLKDWVFLQLKFRREGFVYVRVFLYNSLPASSSAFPY